MTNSKLKSELPIVDKAIKSIVNPADMQFEVKDGSVICWGVTNEVFVSEIRKEAYGEKIQDETIGYIFHYDWDLPEAFRTLNDVQLIQVISEKLVPFMSKNKDFCMIMLGRTLHGVHFVCPEILPTSNSWDTVWSWFQRTFVSDYVYWMTHVLRLSRKGDQPAPRVLGVLKVGPSENMISLGHVFTYQQLWGIPHDSLVSLFENNFVGNLQSYVRICTYEATYKPFSSKEDEIVT